MALIKVGIIMNGVTGRIGKSQHLVNSVIAIRDNGGVLLKNGDRLIPDPIIIGRSAEKVSALASELKIDRWGTDIDAALSNAKDTIFFDSATSEGRAKTIQKAINAGKHVYCEKPVSVTLTEALQLYKLAETKGIKHGVVQDKLWTPGFKKLTLLNQADFFGRLLSVRGEFGYWVFEGDLQKPQRPSWNYKKDEGGGIILDMFCHWRYIIDNLFGEIKSISCIGKNHITARYDETGNKYESDAEDAAYAILELQNGAIVQINSSWCVRVHRDDIFEFQIDGVKGSAVAGLSDVMIQSNVNTPKSLLTNTSNPNGQFYKSWASLPDNEDNSNPFKQQWELFLRHVYGECEFKWNFLAGAKGLQLAELAHQSWNERRWVDIPALD